jgi:hypothetical protein
MQRSRDILAHQGQSKWIKAVKGQFFCSLKPAEKFQQSQTVATGGLDSRLSTLYFSFHGNRRYQTGI